MILGDGTNIVVSIDDKMKNETAPSAVSSIEETTLPTATTTVLSTSESGATEDSLPTTSETTVSSVTEDEMEEDDLSPTLTVTFEPAESSTQTSVTTDDSTILSTLFPNIKVGRIMNESLIGASTDVTNGDLDTVPTSNTEINFNILELLNSTINTNILANVMDIETSTASVEYKENNNEVPSFEVTIDFSDSNNNDVAEEQTTIPMSQVEFQTNLWINFTITEKVPTIGSSKNLCKPNLLVSYDLFQVQFLA